MKNVLVRPFFQTLLNQKGKSFLVQALTLVLISGALAGLYFFYQPVSAKSTASNGPKADPLAMKNQKESSDALEIFSAAQLISPLSNETDLDPRQEKTLLSIEAMRSPAQENENADSNPVGGGLEILPMKGQSCNIQKDKGWKWNPKQQCPTGASIVSNSQKACPQNSTSIGQGCFVASDSEMGRQICADGDPAGQCCFYPCQEQAQSIPVMRCVQEMRPSSYSSETKGCMVFYSCKFLDSEFIHWSLQPPEGAYVEDKAICRSNIGEGCAPGVDCSIPRAQFKCSLAGAEWETNNPPQDALWVDQCKLPPEEIPPSPQ